MHITIMNRTNKPIAGYSSLFRKIAVSAEKQLNLNPELQISVTFVRSASIHKINREYRGIDRPTDVISFACNDAGFCNETAEERKIWVICLSILTMLKDRQKNTDTQ